MAEINYENLVAELIKPLVTLPEIVSCKEIASEDGVIKIEATVSAQDLGRVIGRNGRVANAIRTIAHAAAIRNKQNIEITFKSNEE